MEFFFKDALELIGGYHESTLAFAFEMEEDFYNLLPVFFNKTGLESEDLVKPIVEEIKKLPSKKLSLNRDEIQWSQSLQEDLENPFYSFSKNFGFHGWINIPVRGQSPNLYCFSFLMPSPLELPPLGLKVLADIQSDLRNCL